MDRIDIHLEVTPVPFRELSKERSSESSVQIRNRVVSARCIQEHRFKLDKGIYCNAQMTSQQIRKICKIDEAGEQILKNAMEKLALSARAYNRILKVARTIADLDNSEPIDAHHLAEAIQCRSLDRESWGMN
jgi:magnesium chelatase family protein